MRISITQAIEKALDHTKVILFSPFEAKLWFGLGFCAFLNSFNFNLPGFNFERKGEPTLLKQWLTEHPFAWIPLGVAALGFTVLMIWLQSRGGFMFLDGVLNRSGAVREPWKRFRYLGNSIFRYYLLLILGAGVSGGVLFGIGAGAMARNEQGMRGMGAVILLICILLIAVVFILFAVQMMFARDFLVPIMYRNNIYAMDARRVFQQEIVRGHQGKLLGFYVMKILLAIAAFILMMIGICVTCFAGALPYLNAVIFLPIFVFFRLYSIYYLEQFGPDWWFFQREGEDAGTAEGEIFGDPIVDSDEPPVSPVG